MHKYECEKGERVISIAACWNALKGLMGVRGCPEHGSQVQIRGGKSEIGGGLENVCGRRRTRVEESDKEEKAWRRRGSVWVACWEMLAAF